MKNSWKSISAGNNSGKRGFTLTEVLLAVAIVGVIAALVLPMVVKNYQDKTLDAALKREKQTLESSIASLIVNENTDDYKKTMLYTYAEDPTDYSNSSGAFIKKYLKVSNYCGNSNGKCFASKYYEYKDGDKSVYTPTYKGACASLKNGSSICMEPENPKHGVKLLLDVNGKKGPNVYGRDLHLYEIMLPAKGNLDRATADPDWDYKLVEITPTTPEEPEEPVKPIGKCDVGGDGTPADCCMDTSSDYASRNERICCGNIKDYFDKNSGTCCSKWGSNPWCPSTPSGGGEEKNSAIQLTLEYDRQGNYTDSNPFHGVVIKTSTVNAPSGVSIQCSASCSLSSSASSSRWMVSTIDGNKNFPLQSAAQVGPSCRISPYSGQQGCAAPSCRGYETRDYTVITGSCKVYGSASLPPCVVNIPDGMSKKSASCRIDF